MRIRLYWLYEPANVEFVLKHNPEVDHASWWHRIPLIGTAE